jgi:hypothetical protein
MKRGVGLMGGGVISVRSELVMRGEIEREAETWELVPGEFGRMLGPCGSGHEDRREPRRVELTSIDYST